MRWIFKGRESLLILLSVLSLFACSQIGLQSKKEPLQPSSLRDCEKNFTKEGNWFSGRVYSTQAKYQNLDFEKGFDAAVATIQAHRDRIISTIISTDRASGTIRAEMASRMEQQILFPVDIKLLKEKASVSVHISSKAPAASEPANFCKFFIEFENQVKRATAPPTLKQIPASLKKPPESEKEPSPPAPSPAPPPTPAPPPPSPPQSVLPPTQVIWIYVNLREGPGTNYRVVGKAKKGSLLEILEKKGGWLHVRLVDGKEAWVAKTATSEGSRAPSPPRAPSALPKPRNPM
jgi:hypothetical protein